MDRIEIFLIFILSRFCCFHWRERGKSSFAWTAKGAENMRRGALQGISPNGMKEDLLRSIDIGSLSIKVICCSWIGIVRRF
jgi:hypothetical protein